MTRLTSLGCMALIGLLALTLSGCGSGPGASTDLAPLDKIVEYRGDGDGSLKPLPALGVPLLVDAEEAMPTLLHINAPPQSGQVPVKQVNWYRVDAIPSSPLPLILVVTLQPTANEDSDLFVLNGNASSYGPSGAPLLGMSRRAPTNSGRLKNKGYAPDWVAFEQGDTDGWPAAQVAVYGFHVGSAKKHFRIEVSDVGLMAPGVVTQAFSVEQYRSHWWRLEATSGTQYRVVVTAVSGDPDIFVYEDSASAFVGSNTKVGSGTVKFTASRTCRHYIRVYASAAGDNKYRLRVLSP
jgi:hypothetical protein